MSPIVHNLPMASIGFPRVSGDEPVCYLTLPRHEWFSPRERG